jgi:hypothetical protein
MKRVAAAVVALLLPSAAGAGGLELVGYAGAVVSPYEQTIQLDPGGLILPGGGVVPPGQALQLEASGGNSFGGALTLYLADWIGLEVRLDAAKPDVQATGASYRVVVDLPAPVPDVTGDLELGSGPMELERVHPLSLNLKLRTPGRVALTLSGGLSYLPSLAVVGSQAVRLRAVQVPGVPAGTILAAVGLRAEAIPEEEDSRYGANVGLGLQLGLGEHVALVAEARGFVFQEHRLEWQRSTDGPLAPLEEALARELERRLAPVEFNPNFYQLTAGLSLSF